jgi:hypothetical protein
MSLTNSETRSAMPLIRQAVLACAVALLPAVAYATITPPRGLSGALVASPAYQELYLPGGGGTFIAHSSDLRRGPFLDSVEPMFSDAIKRTDLPAPHSTYTLLSPDRASFHTRLERIPAPGSVTVIVVGAIGLIVARKRHRSKLLDRIRR